MKCPNCSHEFDSDVSTDVDEMVEMIAVSWTEYEHDGWASQHDDGVTLHMNEALAKEYTSKREKSGSYHLFDRAGDQKKVIVKKALLDSTFKSAYGDVINIDRDRAKLNSWEW